MDMKLKKEVALEYITGLMHGGWDDEMISVKLMKQYKLTVPEYTEITMWANAKIEEMFGT